MSRANCCKCNNNMLCCGYNSSTKVTAEGEIYHCVNDRLCATVESADLRVRYNQLYYEPFNITHALNLPSGINEGDQFYPWDNLGLTPLIGADFLGNTFYSYQNSQNIVSITTREHTMKIEHPYHSEKKRFVFLAVTSEYIPGHTPDSYPFESSEYGFGKEVGDDLTIDKDFFSSLEPVRVKTIFNSQISPGVFNKTIEYEPFEFGFKLVVSNGGMTACLDRHMNCRLGSELIKPVLNSPSICQIVTITDTSPDRFLFSIQHSHFSIYEHNEKLPLVYGREMATYPTTRVADNNKKNCMKPGIIDTWVDGNTVNNTNFVISNGWGITNRFAPEAFSLDVYCPYNSTNCNGYISLLNLQEKKSCMDLVLAARTNVGAFYSVNLTTINNSQSLVDSNLIINPSLYPDKNYTDEVDLRDTVLLYRNVETGEFGGTSLAPIEIESTSIAIADTFSGVIQSTNMPLLDISRNKFIAALNTCRAECSCSNMNSNTNIPRVLDVSLNKILTNEAINDIPVNILYDIEAFRAYNYSVVLDAVESSSTRNCAQQANIIIRPDDFTGVLIDGVYFDKVYYLSFITNQSNFAVVFQPMIYNNGIWVSDDTLCKLGGSQNSSGCGGINNPVDPANCVPCGVDIANFNYLCSARMSISNNRLEFTWSSIFGNETLIQDGISCLDMNQGWSLAGYFPYAEYGVTINGRFIITPKYLRYE